MIADTFCLKHSISDPQCPVKANALPWVTQSMSVLPLLRQVGMKSVLECNTERTGLECPLHEIYNCLCHDESAEALRRWLSVLS